MSTIKTYGAMAIMLGCFAMIYPRFMHPIFFGSGSGEAAPKQETQSIYPPGYKGQERGAGGGAHPEDVRRHMRHGPHPGMRAAAEMQRQQSQQGSGRGMMGVVLPMYAVGIVLYLGYTLYKVFNKTNSKNNGRSRYSWDKTGRNSRDKDRMGFPKDYDGRNNEIRNFLHDQEHRQNLEEMLTRVDDKNVSVEEMKVLQQRLEETEAQMTRILQAMRGINSNVDNLAAGEQADADSTPQNNVPAGDDPQSVGVETSSKDGDDKEEATAESVESDKDKEGLRDNDDDNKNDGKNNDGDVSSPLNADDNEEIADDDVDCDGDDQEVVDEMIEEKKDDKAMDDVRQRNVKSNEP